MKLLGLDLGATLGYCYGTSKGHTHVGAERLARGHSITMRCGDLQVWLEAFVAAHEQPDEIAVENYLPPAASFSGASSEGQIMLHGALHGFCGPRGIRVTAVSINTLRVHFCGQAGATPAIRGRKRTSAEKNAARLETKRMVIKRALQLGYVPRDRAVAALADRSESVEFGMLSAMADGACVFDWALAHLARSPSAFELFATGA